MAEFLVRVEDKVNKDDPYLDAKCLKRGDVVVVCPDGWAWSALEQKNSFWRIVRVPGMTMSEAEAYLAPEPGDPLLNKMLQRRQFKLDVDSPLIPTPVKTVISDPTRTVATFDLSVTDARAIKVLKPALADPKVIG